MQQLARDLQSALDRGDIEMVTLAAGLLAPALADCREASASLDLSAGEAAEMAMATRRTLDECETTLMQAMAQISTEVRRLQQGKRAVVAIRSRAPGGSGSKLDTSR
jgi:hypothetical protein